MTVMPSSSSRSSKIFLAISSHLHSIISSDLTKLIGQESKGIPRSHREMVATKLLVECFTCPPCYCMTDHSSKAPAPSHALLPVPVGVLFCALGINMGEGFECFWWDEIVPWFACVIAKARFIFHLFDSSLWLPHRTESPFLFPERISPPSFP